MPASITGWEPAADVGDTWRAWLVVTDLDGVAAAATVTAAVTLPDATSAAAVVTAQTPVGLYLASHKLTVAGTHTIVITVASTVFGDDVIAGSVHVRALAGGLPDMSALKSYLGDTSFTDEEIADALSAETAAQAGACTIPAAYPEDLSQALKRRVARNLAARAVPVASFTSFDGGGTSVRVPKVDTEIDRLEGRHRRMVVG